MISVKTVEGETQVFTEDGLKVEGVTAMNISFTPGSPPVAVVQVDVAHEVIKAHPLLSFETLETVAAFYGYDLVQQQDKANVDHF